MLDTLTYDVSNYTWMNERQQIPMEREGEEERGRKNDKTRWRKKRQRVDCLRKTEKREGTGRLRMGENILPDLPWSSKRFFCLRTS